MRILALLIALVLSQPLAAETVRLGDRWYRIELPANPKGAPLILALHGGGGDPDQFAQASGLARVATRAGFAVVFPAGTGRRGDRLLTWNGGYCCGPSARRGVDDMGFLKQVIADAAQRFGVDGQGVYLTGMSNGAILAETFAAQNPDLVRAVAGVSGTMDTSRTRVQGRVPALIIHGTADTMVPYEGGQGDTSLTRTDFASVPSVVQAFLAPWGGVLAETRRSIDTRDDGTSITVTDYQRRGKVVLRLMTVQGGGHHWPGGRKARLTEGKTQEIDANTEILRFFAAHP
ncbi:MAG: PHB depolymerase family esterase [Tabrizicola sp.]|uniref:extracellular catalytic domain type 1 short-chain-length polyhydroxyalkanoate depolymerase n=1 Tax=Tabrizicola sp. TaxID=2005166 RepID=UPI002ABC767B|nr:PHB depolymerase family esterase [Tabrizicola sp.]MDZ4086534.1 PHB depolymerase family esterase [Tabrizicola sp.]